MHSLSIDPNLLQIRLGYEPCLGRMETHLIKLMTEDELNRWSHGLAYGGFLRTAAASAPPPLPSAPPSSRPPSVREEEILVNVSVPEGVAFDGVPTSRERHDGHIQYNEARNVLIITSPDDTSPLTIPCSLVTMSVDKDAHAITFKSAEASTTTAQEPVHPNPLAAVAGAGKYYQPPAKLTPPPSPKEPEESTEKPKPPEDDEVFVIRDGYLMLFEKAGDPQPILKLHNADCVTLADATNREFVITHKPGTPEEETYVFSFPTDEIYQGWYNKLEENGFLRRKGDQRGRTANQVGVVSKGCLELYKDYGAPQAKPVITLMANRCSATASRERREIRIIHTNPSGKRERITLDCASLAEFDRCSINSLHRTVLTAICFTFLYDWVCGAGAYIFRWNVALHFGNFLKGEDLQVIRNLSSQDRFCMRTRGLDRSEAPKIAPSETVVYVFPINMFEDASGRKSALLIENRMIMLFPTPDATDPILCFHANECEVQPVIAQRKLRVYVNRNTRREQRIDFILPLAKDLDRKGLMAVYKSKFEPPRKATVTSPDSRERWEFALKLTGFKPFSTVQLPRFFLPQIIYGFVAEEASELRKEGLLGNARAALGLLNLQRENRGSTFQTDQQTHRSQPRSDSGSR
ncbi:hypothetical protein, conserved [Eimeria maxima]|uniref:PH domain-containing protein n=1 Tax=Eimeria maxima TaxID=5804 RepID=U6M2K9_EIMMA|nr:hypothetical protein, conserved [Eimeria maxima]CDJ58246.1 hypothetical protein, conserved [Eimeria maxima]